MQSKKIIIFILSAFIAGTLLLVTIQYNSSKNIDKLIKGNEILMNEFKINSKLSQLEKNIITVESRVRGAIVIRNSAYFIRFNNDISEIFSLLGQLQKLSNDDLSEFYIDRLDTLIKEKLLFNQQVLNNLQQKGKLQAEELISSQYGKTLTDSIVVTMQQIDSTRKIHLASAIESIDKSGKKAQQFSLVLILIVLVCGAGLFWYIINIIRRQISLIRKLNISERKVKESARIKENFMANMSHEIRTPMNAILGFTNLLQRKSLDEDSREYVSTIEQSGENLLTIINDILDLSKLEAGMVKIEHLPFSIRALMHSLKIMFDNKASEKNIRLITTIEEALPDILVGDVKRLTQILINLVSNAIKFTEKGSITVSLADNGKEGDFLNLGIKVADTGIGIENDKQQKIFDRFQQAEDSITRNYGGTGLGLSIVKDLVTLQKGTIVVESYLGKGTTFKLMIPYGISRDQGLNEAIPIEKELDFKSGPVSLKLLVVEDNLVNQSLLRHLFKSWNLDFDLAGNGKEAIDRLQSHPYNLILMDIQMPVMDGYTTTREIRQTLGLKTPVIAMTAHALTDEKEKCFQYGMNDYISKPLREKELHRLIDKYTRFRNDNTGTSNAPRRHSGYQVINLKYMQEISAGDQQYEKEVTGLFIESIPGDLAELETAWKNNDIKLLRQLTHNMRTTVSIMGLNNCLDPLLQPLEYESINEPAFQKNYQEIVRICNAAMEEARNFYSTFTYVN